MEVKWKKLWKVKNISLEEVLQNGRLQLTT